MCWVHSFLEKAVQPWHRLLGQCWSPHPWQGLKPTWMWYMGTWVSASLDNAEGTVALSDCRGPFQPKWFHDSTKPATVCWSSSTFFNRRPGLPSLEMGLGTCRQAPFLCSCLVTSAIQLLHPLPSFLLPAPPSSPPCVETTLSSLCRPGAGDGLCCFAI